MPLLRKTKKHRCPDGTTRLVHRNIDDAFPLHFQGVTANAATSLEAIAGAPVSLEAGYERKAEHLAFALGELNESVMMSFRAVYAVYQSDPCTHSDFLMRKIDHITFELQRLTGLRMQLRTFVELAAAHPEQTDRTWDTYMSLVEALQPVGSAEAAAHKIDIARDNAQRWITPGPEAP